MSCFLCWGRHVPIRAWMYAEIQTKHILQWAPGLTSAHRRLFSKWIPKRERETWGWKWSIIPVKDYFENICPGIFWKWKPGLFYEIWFDQYYIDMGWYRDICTSWPEPCGTSPKDKCQMAQTNECIYLCINPYQFYYMAINFTDFKANLPV